MPKAVADYLVFAVHTQSADVLNFHHHFDGSAGVDHRIHYLMIGVGVVLYALVVVWMMYKGYKRTGKWQLPK